MPGTTVLFGQILAVFGIVSTGTWAASQWTAAQRG
jgi:type IV secretion system protein VirD4